MDNDFEDDFCDNSHHINSIMNNNKKSLCNIFKVAENAINKKKRPTYLCREKTKLLSPTMLVRTQSKITRV